MLSENGSMERDANKPIKKFPAIGREFLKMVRYRSAPGAFAEADRLRLLLLYQPANELTG